MRLPFRQGIVRADVGNFIQSSPSGISVNTSNSIVQLAFAQRETNYLHTEHTNAPNAWPPLPTTSNFYLYVDLDKKTGIRTFGYTEVAPSYGLTAPIAPVETQHWFDTTTFEMKEYKSAISQWVPVIRLFVASYDNGAVNEYPIGTQVGITNPQPIFQTGAIIFDDSGKAIIRPNKIFFTTEDTLFVNGLSAHAVRLESNIFQVKAQENMAAFSVVFLPAFGEARLADYENIGTQTLGIITEDVLIDEMVGMILQGIVKNVNWNWSAPGRPVWVDLNGELTEIDPHVTDINRLPQVPIARTVTEDTIIFEQGLGGKGEKGEPGEGRYEIEYFIPDLLTVPNKMVGSHLVSRNTQLTNTLPESIAYCRVPPAANVSYDLQVDGVSVGSVNFLAGQNDGTFTLAASVSLVHGQRLEIVTPPVIDVTIEDVTINIIGCVVAKACPTI